MKLQPLSTFVLDQTSKEKGFELSLDRCVHEAFANIINYTEFLKQPLKISMFTPINENGDYWLAPTYYGGSNALLNDIELDKWEKAKEKVLFKGFKLKDYYAEYTGEDEMIYIDEEFCEDMTIESFLNTIISELELTESALKQIGIDE